jgi:hypothetical protein
MMAIFLLLLIQLALCRSKLCVRNLKRAISLTSNRLSESIEWQIITIHLYWRSQIAPPAHLDISAYSTTSLIIILIGELATLGERRLWSCMVSSRANSSSSWSAHVPGTCSWSTYICVLLARVSTLDCWSMADDLTLLLMIQRALSMCHRPLTLYILRHTYSPSSRLRCHIALIKSLISHSSRTHHPALWLYLIYGFMISVGACWEI